MGYRTRKTLLWSACVALAAGIAALACVAAFMPLDPAATAAPKGSNGDGAKTPPPVRQVLPLERYAAVSQRDLRKPLFDAPPGKAETRSKRKLAVTLVGTAVDPGFTYGMFRDASGKTVLVRVGQTIADAEVLAVEEGSATVRFDGETITLYVPGKEKKP